MRIIVQGRVITKGLRKEFSFRDRRDGSTAVRIKETREGEQRLLNTHAITTMRHTLTNAHENNHRSRHTAARNAREKSYISVLYTSVHSLILKRNELSVYVATEKPDVVAITETWSNSADLVSQLSVPGYKIFQKNKTNKKGGDVICYVKSTLAAIKIDKKGAENYDSVYVEITRNNEKLILAVVYRHPKLQAADDTTLYNEIQSLIQGKNEIIIGDFNCANVDLRLLIGIQDGSKLINMVEDSFLTQVINQLTRENILDLVLVSDPDLLRNFETWKHGMTGNIKHIGS